MFMRIYFIAFVHLSCGGDRCGEQMAPEVTRTLFAHPVYWDSIYVEALTWQFEDEALVKVTDGEGCLIATYRKTAEHP